MTSSGNIENTRIITYLVLLVFHRRVVFLIIPTYSNKSTIFLEIVSLRCVFKHVLISYLTSTV